jgi:hypothetical protein
LALIVCGVPLTPKIEGCATTLYVPLRDREPIDVEPLMVIGLEPPTVKVSPETRVAVMVTEEPDPTEAE